MIDTRRRRQGLAEKKYQEKGTKCCDCSERTGEKDKISGVKEGVVERGGATHLDLELAVPAQVGVAHQLQLLHQAVPSVAARHMATGPHCRRRRAGRRS